MDVSSELKNARLKNVYLERLDGKAGQISTADESRKIGVDTVADSIVFSNGASWSSMLTNEDKDELADDISDNATGIATNAGNVSANTSGILNNKQDIVNISTVHYGTKTMYVGRIYTAYNKYVEAYKTLIEDYLNDNEEKDISSVFPAGARNKSEMTPVNGFMDTVDGASSMWAKLFRGHNGDSFEIWVRDSGIFVRSNVNAYRNVRAWIEWIGTTEYTVGP